MAPSSAERVTGCLVGGAVGDALGAPVEFWSLSQIRDRLGEGGVTGYLPAYGRDGGAITDDTQMTLFTVEGLLIAAQTDADPVDGVYDAYLRWLATQQDTSRPGGEGLAAEAWLWSRRAPGNTCLGALRSGRAGSIHAPINDSKGFGGVMRAAPAGLVRAADPFDLGSRCAALAHGHPSGFLPAGVLAAIVAAVVGGADLTTALETARQQLSRYPGHQETTSALDAGTALAERGRPAPEDLERLGGGWTGEEALAIAVACALTGDSPADALLMAVKHSGDTDSTAAICGNIVGCHDGVAALPAEWVAALEGADTIGRLAEQLSTTFWTHTP